VKEENIFTDSSYSEQEMFLSPVYFCGQQRQLSAKPKGKTSLYLAVANLPILAIHVAPFNHLCLIMHLGEKIKKFF
jgi:hypothetical protein